MLGRGNLRTSDGRPIDGLSQPRARESSADLTHALSQQPDRPASADVDAIVWLRVACTIAIAAKVILYIADRYFEPSRSHELIVLGSFLTLVLCGLLFAATFAKSLKRHWRLLIFAFASGVVMIETTVSIADRSPLPLFIVMVLVAVASGAFAPWGPRWQAVLNIFFLIDFVVAVYLLPAAARRVDHYEDYRFAGLLTAILIAQWAAVLGQRYRSRARSHVQELGTQARKQAAVAMLGIRALEAGALESLIYEAVDLAAATLEVDYCEVWERTSDPQVIALAAVSGRQRGGLDHPTASVRPDSQVGDTLRTLEPVVVEDYARENRLTPHGLLAPLGVRSGVTVAIQVRGRAFGVLCAHSRRAMRFGADDVNFLQSIANVLGLSIESERAEQDLRRSEVHFRSLIENSSDIIAEIDADGVVSFASPSAQRVLGYRPEEIVGANVLSFIHSDDVEAVRRGLRRAFEPNSDPPLQYRHRHQDGSWRVLEVNGEVLNDGTGSHRLVITARDITERKRAESELAKARDAALESVRLKSSFLANMSHEIRTPVNVILGYSELIGEHLAESGDGAVVGYLEAINRAGSRLLGTIQQILDFSRIESGAFELRPVALELSELVRRQVEDLGVLATRKGLALVCSIEEPAAVIFDEYCLGNALTNLIQNAIKFTERGEIAVNLHRDSDGAPVLEVRDTGVGIDPDYLPRLFEPFTQEQSGYSRRFEGSGLGLALTRRYLELNGAQLTVQSEKGAGSVFSIRFSSAADPAQSMPTANSFNGARVARPCILVVEDDPDTEAYMKALLASRYDVVTARSADEVHRKLGNGAAGVNVILMDLALKGAEDGLALTQFLRSRDQWKRTPIIAVTAHALNEDREHALAAGCNAFLSKPVSRQALLSTIDQMMAPAADGASQH